MFVICQFNVATGKVSFWHPGHAAFYEKYDKEFIYGTQLGAYLDMEWHGLQTKTNEKVIYFIAKIEGEASTKFNPESN